jgi:hypothetical protein
MDLVLWQGRQLMFVVTSTSVCLIQLAYSAPHYLRSNNPVCICVCSEWRRPVVAAVYHAFLSEVKKTSAAQQINLNNMPSTHTYAHTQHAQHTYTAHTPRTHGHVRLSCLIYFFVKVCPWVCGCVACGLALRCVHLFCRQLRNYFDGCLELVWRLPCPRRCIRASTPTPCSLLHAQQPQTLCMHNMPRKHQARF